MEFDLLLLILDTLYLKLMVLVFPRNGWSLNFVVGRIIGQIMDKAVLRTAAI